MHKESHPKYRVGLALLDFEICSRLILILDELQRSIDIWALTINKSPSTLILMN